MRRHTLPLPAFALAGALTLVATACGDDGDAAGGGDGGPAIVVTTSILGDVVEQIVGDDAQVTVVMPAGADPHDFQASARQAAEMREADLLVVNGGGFEAGLDDAIEGAEDDGVTVFAALDHVPTLAAGPQDDEHDENDEDDGNGGDDHADEEGGVDPHFFTDPARMAAAVEALTVALTDEVPALDTPDLRDRAAGYVADLRALDAEIETTLAAVPADQRKLVTNHDVFAYFADRYGFEVVGAVIPSTTTQAAPSAGEIDELASTMAAAGVRAVFADTSSPEDLAEALAAEVGGDVAVVALYSESLGEVGSRADTYAGMIRTNTDRIAGALAP